MNEHLPATVRGLTDQLVDEMLADIMIGYLFVGVDRTRLKQLEYEQAMQALGHADAYSGRPLRQAHARHRINAAQFDRRTMILKRLLTASELGKSEQTRWLAHVETLREDIVQNPDLKCSD